MKCVYVIIFSLLTQFNQISILADDLKNCSLNVYINSASLTCDLPYPTLSSSEEENFSSMYCYKCKYLIENQTEKFEYENKMITGKFEETVSVSCYINNLLSSTNYKINVSINSCEEVDVYPFSFQQIVEFKTECLDINPNDMDLAVTSSSVTIKPMKGIKNECPLWEYKATAIDRQFENIFTNLTNLPPCNNFTLNLTRTTSTHKSVSLFKNFTTLTSVPTVETVERLYAYPNSVEIVIGKSNKCRIDKYFVKYKYEGNTQCNSTQSTNNPQITVEEFSNRLEIKNLKCSSNYSFQLQAENIEGLGPESPIRYFTTMNTNQLKIEHDELPTEIKVHDFNWIEITQPDCKKLQGPIAYNITFSCKSDWCTEKDLVRMPNIPYDNKNAILKKYIPKNLRPFSNYSVVVEVIRKNVSLTNRWLCKSFISAPSTPLKVTHLEMYAKSNKTASFRWKPPYPPTGDIEYYSISVGIDSGKTVDRNETCPMWPDYICTTIKAKPINGQYKVQIQAKHKIVLQDGIDKGEWSNFTFNATEMMKLSMFNIPIPKITDVAPVGKKEKIKDNFLNITLVVAISLSGSLILIFCLGIICLCRSRKKGAQEVKKKRKQEHPLEPVLEEPVLNPELYDHNDVKYEVITNYNPIGDTGTIRTYVSDPSFNEIIYDRCYNNSNSSYYEYQPSVTIVRTYYSQ